MATTAYGWDSFFSTTLSSAITSTDTTIPLAAAPTATEGVLVIEPNSSTNREIIYYTSVSGNSVILPSVAAGRGQEGTTAVAHSSGVAVKRNTTSRDFEVLQDGTALAASSITTAKIAAGAVTNAKLSTTAGEIGAAWQSWTPTWTNFTVGNAVANYHYIQIGKTVHFRVAVVLGTTSVVGTSVQFTLPVTARASVYNLDSHPLGNAMFLDTGVADYFGIVRPDTTTTAQILAFSAAGTYVSVTALGAAVPFAWANGDKISISGTYEAA